MVCADVILERGLEIPEQIGVMAFDDHPFSLIIEPKFTVVDINIRNLTRQVSSGGR